MLKQLTLKNFLLVDALEIDWHGGLTTITGESGAGKSILLAALGLLLGERANPDLVRPGAEKADVSAEFDLTGLACAAQLAADELQSDTPGECLIRRVVAKGGRSKAFINGVPVTTQYLRSLGAELVEIYGQNAHIRLSERHRQLALLDDYAKLNDKVAQTRQAYLTWQQNEQRISELREQVEQARDRQELLRYQLQELETLALAPGEFQQLDSEYKRLANAQETLATLQQVEQALEEMDDLRHAAAAIASIDDNQAALNSGQSNLQDGLALLDDAAHDLRRYTDQVTVNPAALAEVESRLNEALSLARKHRVDPILLAEHTATLQAELESLSDDDQSLETLTAEAAALREKFITKAQTLSNKRRKAAPQFAKAVTQHMRTLGMPDGKFSLAFAETEGETGLDRVEFQVTTNPNFPAGNLTEIASGGEQTRISLSIQIVAAKHSALPCLILDEADVGVGGTTADTVGRILRELGANAQVICITHAPQVAALGNQHLQVIKQGDRTQIQHLDAGLRVDELARMLAGADITDKTRDYAATLLAEAT
ncbi:MAG: DNA repair protein RecN [Pseudomonadota bacterium]